MKFSEMAGTAIVPTLARLVLGLAFITVGYNKLGTTTTFTATEAATLADECGVDVTPVAAAAFVDGDRIIYLAQSRKPLTRPGDGAKSEETPTPVKAPEPPADEPAAETPADKPAAKPAEKPAEDEPVGPPAEEVEAEDAPRGIPVDEIEDVEPVVEEPVVEREGEFEARTMHKVTLLCHGAGWPMAKWFALIASITEFVGGILLVIGLFSRIWALGLSVAMGVAFYLVSMRINGVHTTNPFEFAQNIGAFNTAVSQLGLFVLAFGVLLAGPGPVSLDRRLFRPSPPSKLDEDGVIIYDDPME